MKNDKIVNSVRKWVESFVVGMNLCPFAKRELVKRRIRTAITDANNEERLLMSLRTELELLNNDLSIETTLLIHPEVLQDFYDYNQFLNRVDSLLALMKLEGVFQIASFHPNYQFDGTNVDDAENYTNRSPYPMLHIIREASLEKAIADFPDVNHITDRNIALMNCLGSKKLKSLLLACFDDVGEAKS